MGQVLKMAPSMEQREATAKAILDRVNFDLVRDRMTPDEVALVQDVIEGRAITAGRLAMLQELEKKYVGGKQ